MGSRGVCCGGAACVRTKATHIASLCHVRQGSHNVVMYDVSKAPLALTKPLWVGSDHTVRTCFAGVTSCATAGAHH